MIVAFEGVSYSGKSTTSRKLSKYLNDEYLKKTFSFQCYVSMVNHDSRLPKTNPSSTTNQHLDATKFYVDLEQKRYSTFKENLELYDCYILDRSYLTLIAHLYAIEEIYNIKVFNSGKELVVNRGQIIIPDIVFYLDVNQSILNERYIMANRNYDEGIFINTKYNDLFREFFLTEAKALHPNIIFMSGEGDLDSLISIILKYI